MPRTIALPDPLVSRLEKSARSQRTTVDALVVSLLDRAVAAPDSTDDWPELNARRTALIRQRFATGLNPAETAELQRLQEQADQHVESLDAEMLRDVAALCVSVEQALAESSSSP